MNYFNESIHVMKELYGKDVPMTLATINEGKPNVRVVDTYFDGNAFYVSSYKLSKKCREIEKNSNVALNHNLFVAHGVAEDIGNPLEVRNKEIREKLIIAFKPWYEKHVNEVDENTCYIKISLTDAIIFANNYKYYIDFKSKEASREDFVIDIIF